LDLDPGHLATLEALARIYQEGGDTANALAAYSAARLKHPDNLPLAIRHLAFTYQIDASPLEAAVALRARLRAPQSQDRRAVAEGYVHLAVVERLLGNATQAQAAALKAEELRPGPDVALQRFLLGLDAGDLSLARAELAKIQGRMGDPGLESVLEGRLRIAEGAFGDAYEACRRGAEADPRRVDALLCAASAAARAGKQDEAVRSAFQAANADPTRVAPRPVMTRFYIRDGETLAGLDGYLLKLAAGETDVSPLVAEGVLLFHQGSLIDADKMLRRALKVDEGNALALAYRSLISVVRGERAAAVQSGKAAAEAGRRIAVARYAYGAALAAAGAAGTASAAEKELRAALELEPGFSAAEVKLAQLEAKRGDEAAARARLVRVVVRDPTYLLAKRALYRLDSGGGKSP
jgi:tetratricopeptide (TPR) repeat protein